MMENLHKRFQVDLIRASEVDRLRRLIVDLTYLSHKIFNGNLTDIYSVKCKLTLNRPCYVRQAILDLSKHLIYDFWYNQIKANYGSRAQLLYTDTDSLLMVLEMEDAYADMKQNAAIYNCSNYPKDHSCYSMVNKKVVGKFKNECANMVVV